MSNTVPCLSTLLLNRYEALTVVTNALEDDVKITGVRVWDSSKSTFAYLDLSDIQSLQRCCLLAEDFIVNRLSDEIVYVSFKF